MTREALNLARGSYNQPKLRVRDVRATKLVDFENIASKFKVNIRLYEPNLKVNFWIESIQKFSSKC